MPRNRLQKRPEFAIHQDSAQASRLAAKPPELDAPAERTLSPASTGAINSMKGRGNAAAAKTALGRSATVRSVPSFEGSESSPESKNSGGFSSSVNSNTNSNASAMSHHDRTPPMVRLKSDSSSVETPTRWNGTGAKALEQQQQQQQQPLPHDSSVLSDGAEPEAGQWDSTIGKAGLGKTGRVINKLVSDNDALKRDIKIEQLRAEESKQAAKLIEDKMDRVVSDYESRLLEANVTKTLLARKERQVETLTATVESEKKKTQAAQEREHTWKEEMDKMRTETTVQVEEATTHAQLMEGRYNAIASHWREQGDEVKRAVSKTKDEIDGIVEERRADDEKIQMLRDLCDQQDANIKGLQREKEEIALRFERYKQTQDDDLRDIKTLGKRRDEEQERLLEESREALDKLRWALNVKKTVKGAQ